MWDMCTDSTKLIREEQEKRGRTQVLLKTIEGQIHPHTNHVRATKFLLLAVYEE